MHQPGPCLAPQSGSQTQLRGANLGMASLVPPRCQSSALGLFMPLASEHTVTSASLARTVGKSKPGCPHVHYCIPPTLLSLCWSELLGPPPGSYFSLSMASITSYHVHLHQACPGAQSPLDTSDMCVISNSLRLVHTGSPFPALAILAVELYPSR